VIDGAAIIARCSSAPTRSYWMDDRSVREFGFEQAQARIASDRADIARAHLFALHSKPRLGGIGPCRRGIQARLVAKTEAFVKPDVIFYIEKT
jgi:hypothetical protein